MFRNRPGSFPALSSSHIREKAYDIVVDRVWGSGLKGLSLSKLPDASEQKTPDSARKNAEKRQMPIKKTDK
jgi:hypothetical protein